MSIEEHCSKDEIDLYLKVAQRGDTLGTKYTLKPLGTRRCRAESLSAEEIRDYAAFGMRATHRFMFSSDPRITPQNHIGYPVGSKTIMHVTAVTDQGRPGETLLWIVLCELKTTRDRPEV